jgi:ATP-dependent Clp protease ATP-binding subunit ClpC
MLYDRFTEGARKAMAFARQESQRFHHDFIDTEHILLGLMRVGDCTAVAALHMDAKMSANL